MKVNIVPIGNSQGIRIPRSLLRLCHIQKEVALDIKGNAIVIRPVETKSREGWEEKFKTMHALGEDQLLIDDRIDLEMDDWEW